MSTVSIDGGRPYEVTLIGRGYGECIVMHCGNDEWVIIDSCRPNGQKDKSAAQIYLDEMGVAPDCVKHIIISHWHDDHIRGMYGLVDYYDKSAIWVSNIIYNEKVVEFVAGYGNSVPSIGAYGTRELWAILRYMTSAAGKLRSKFISDNTEVLDRIGGEVRLKALSPTFNDELAWMSRIFHLFDQFKKGFLDLKLEHKPNHESVVMKLDLEKGGALLGSDMEIHSNGGWLDVVRAHPGSRRSNLYKVAHHGSKTGHLESVWTDLLTDDVISIITPFELGRVFLPTEDDVVRIKSKSRKAFITSRRESKPEYGKVILKTLGQISTKVTALKTKVNKFGLIRMTSLDGSVWQEDLRNAAVQL